MVRDDGEGREQEIVSPVYYKLKDYNAEKYSHLFSEMQEMIFCIAYTEYCDDKKNHIKKSLSDAEIEPTGNAVTKAHVYFDTPEKYENYCLRARAKIDGLIALAAKEALYGVAGLVVDELKPKKLSFKDHAIKIMLHAVEIVIAALIIIGCAEILAIVAPWLIETFRKVGWGYFDKV